MDKAFEKHARFMGNNYLELKDQNLELEVIPEYEIPGLQPWKPFKAKEAKDLAVKYARQQTSAETTFNKVKNGPPDKAAAAQKQLNQLKEANVFLQDLNELYQTLNNQGKIYYSVFIPHGKFKVELFNTPVRSDESAESKDKPGR